jgi:hypothetical protein
MRSFAWVGKAVHGVGANALSNLLLFELTKEGCSWMLALGLFSLAAVANQVVIELFRRGQAGKVGAFSSSQAVPARHEPLPRETGVGDE